MNIYDEVLSIVDADPQLSRAGLVRAIAVSSLEPNLGQTGPLANMYFRPMYFGEIGSCIPLHQHNFDHVLVVCAGKILVRFKRPDAENFEEVVHQPGARVLIRRDRPHELVALEDNSYGICCFGPQEGVGWQEATN